MGRLFGTDGIRGLAGGEVLTAELTTRLAAAAALELLGDQLAHRTRPVVVLGRDTRPSGQMLEAAAFAGFASVGCDAQPHHVAAHRGEAGEGGCLQHLP